MEPGLLRCCACASDLLYILQVIELIEYSRALVYMSDDYILHRCPIWMKKVESTLHKKRDLIRDEVSSVTHTSAACYALEPEFWTHAVSLQLCHEATKSSSGWLYSSFKAVNIEAAEDSEPTCVDRWVRIKVNVEEPGDSLTIILLDEEFSSSVHGSRMNVVTNQSVV